MGLILAWMYSTPELDELFQILNSVKGFKLNNHKGATQHYFQEIHLADKSCLNLANMVRRIVWI